MRPLVFAGALALLCAVGDAPEAVAFPAAAAVDSAASPTETVQVGPGYYRRRFYRERMHRYRDNPGARYELRRQRQRFCRAAPSRC